jgi:hypothetical protein
MSSEITKFIIFPCEECRKKLRVPAKKKIKLIICPSCKKKYHVEKGVLENIEEDPELGIKIEHKED